MVAAFVERESIRQRKGILRLNGGVGRVNLPGVHVIQHLLFGPNDITYPFVHGVQVSIGDNASDFEQSISFDDV